MTSSIQVSELIERNYVRRYLPSDQGGQLVIPFQSDDELRALQAHLAMRAKDHSIAVDDVDVDDLVVRLTEHAIMELDADEENTLQIEAWGKAAEKEIRAALVRSPQGDEVARCSDCGNAHDPQIRCPNFHAGMMPTARAALVRSKPIDREK